MVVHFFSDDKFFFFIKFYRKPSAEKISGLWKCLWDLEFSSEIIFINLHHQRDSLFVFTNEGKFFEISIGDDDVPRLEMIFRQGSGYLFLVTINPSGLNVGAVDCLNQLTIFEGCSGRFLGNLSLDLQGKSKNKKYFSQL